MSGLIPSALGTITKRHTGVDATTGVDIKFSTYNVKGVLIHIEGSTSVATVTGTLSVTGSAPAVITSDGTNINLEGEWPAGKTITTIKAPSGTINVSVIAWR